MGPVHYSRDPRTSLFSNFFIKNGFHDTIHIFKNYFATVFSVFSKISYIQMNPLHSKLFECTFCTLNYNPCYTLHLNIKFVVNLDGNSNFRMQSIILVLFWMIRCNLFFVFKVLRIRAIRSFHVVPYFSIHVNRKLNVRM